MAPSRFFLMYSIASLSARPPTLSTETPLLSLKAALESLPSFHKFGFILTALNNFSCFSEKSGDKKFFEVVIIYALDGKGCSFILSVTGTKEALYCTIFKQFKFKVVPFAILKFKLNTFFGRRKNIGLVGQRFDKFRHPIYKFRRKCYCTIFVPIFR